ncbi:hypothetical protein GCK72_005349 [Caenorhabditis remanei]|uniref:V-type proton ATPase subunit a n=1 Tax=Caenorhabditis remanei TaxID=31234 RepID=A0A6A5HE53_CAERE|nr:hypothetical protein GCK72_005349 [Caenorhabditis remanei]KAF1765397.1 hypothetical protein GCK72_005349 [Caenorhabditis remanei]
MGSTHRSENEKRFRIVCSQDSAYQYVAELEEMGLTQFIDLNEDESIFEAPFRKEIIKCEEMEKQIISIEIQLKRESCHIPDYSDHVPTPSQNGVEILHKILNKTEEELNQIRKNISDLYVNHRKLLDLKTILENIPNFGTTQDSYFKVRMEDQQEFLTGVIKSAKKTDFDTFLRRMSRAQIFTKLIPIQKTNSMIEPREKKVFILFFSGDKQREKVKIICEGLHAKCYTIPNSPEDRTEFLKKVTEQSDQMKSVIRNTEDYRGKIMRSVGRNVVKWRIMNQKMEKVFHIVNMFHLDSDRNCLIGECWTTEAESDNIRNVLKTASLKLEGSKCPVFEEIKIQEDEEASIKL